MINIHSHFAPSSGGHGFRVGHDASSQATPAGSEPSRALSSMQGKALEALAREIPDVESADLRQLDPRDFTPEKVAGRISDFVAMGLESARARGKSEGEIQAMYESALKGVEQGFAEAKDILKHLDLLEGRIAEQVAATERATFDKLAQLAPGSGAVQTGGTTGIALAERYFNAEDFELELQTRDGDLVKVSFGRDLEAQSRFASVADGEGNQVRLLDVSRVERTGYELSVQGDLSADEIDAIQGLIQDVGQVAKDFFNGDVQRAFDQASDLSIDGTQLASMNLHMSRVEQYSAARVYRETEQSASPERASAGRRLGHLMNQLEEGARNPALQFLDRPREAAGELMRGLVQQDGRYRDSAPEQQSRFDANLGRLLQGLYKTE